MVKSIGETLNLYGGEICDFLRKMNEFSAREEIEFRKILLIS